MGISVVLCPRLICSKRKGCAMKKIVLMIMVLGVLFVCVGCGSKTVMTNETFCSTLEDKGFVVQDTTAQYTDFVGIDTASVAVSPDGYQIEFLVCSDVGVATSMFNQNKDAFEAEKPDSGGSTASVSGSNYDQYTQTCNGLYYHIGRTDNTLLYVRAPKEYEKDIEQILSDF